MKKSKIDAIHIRRNRFGLTGIVYSEGYTYAVRYAPDTVVTEEVIRKSWRERRSAFRAYDDVTGHIKTSHSWAVQNQPV